MRKKSFFVLVFLSAVLILASCASTKTWDASLPAENSAILKPKGNFNITKYNGVDVDWKNASQISIPSGTTELTISGRYSRDYVYYTITDSVIRYGFLPGSTYRISFGYKLFSSRLTVTITDITLKTKDYIFLE